MRRWTSNLVTRRRDSSALVRAGFVSLARVSAGAPREFRAPAVGARHGLGGDLALAAAMVSDPDGFVGELAEPNAGEALRGTARRRGVAGARQRLRSAVVARSRDAVPIRACASPRPERWRSWATRASSAAAVRTAITCFRTERGRVGPSVAHESGAPSHAAGSRRHPC